MQNIFIFSSKRIISSKYRNAGQTCVCANRIYVQDGVYDAFAAKLAEKVKGFKVGAGTEAEPGALLTCGGEFFISSDACRARDHFGIIPGDIPAGHLVCGATRIGTIDPTSTAGSLDAAIRTAVALRADEGIVALSGGLDSSLIAALAGRDCVTVGVPGSHDLARGMKVADLLRLHCEPVGISLNDIEEALHRIARTIPSLTPLAASIAVTQYFVAEYAADAGYRRILCGQGADELFGGYARYLRSENLGADLERDFDALLDQVSRDQAVASLFGTYFSLPYLDLRVVRAARAIPVEEKVAEGIRKRPLRAVAQHYLPREVAEYEKKAMQYGSGIWRAIRTLARNNGYKKSLQGYIDQLGCG